MKRRDFIALAGGALAVRFQSALAQGSGRTWRMGFVAHGYEKFYEGLFTGLKELGYVEGKNLIVDRRYAAGQAERFPEFAAEMVQQAVDVIVVTTTPAAQAIKKATTTIPVVFPNAISPVESGLIASLANPGGNITGGAAQTAALSIKRLEILKQVLPGLSKVAVLWNGANAALAYPWNQTKAAAAALGIEVQALEVRDQAAIAPALAKISENRPDAFIVLQDALTLQHREEILDFALQNQLPGMYVAREWVSAGGLMSYGENLWEMYHRGAYFVDRIFKGAKPADLPVEQVTKFELIINLKTANAMKMTLPPTIIAIADDVIE
jgi:putative tryptophan/tyrosine transport system substrate-binding protein